jgi:hypothetical protein
VRTFPVCPPSSQFLHGHVYVGVGLLIRKWFGSVPVPPAGRILISTFSAMYFRSAFHVVHWSVGCLWDIKIITLLLNRKKTLWTFAGLTCISLPWMTPGSYDLLFFPVHLFWEWKIQVHLQLSPLHILTCNDVFRSARNGYRPQMEIAMGIPKVGQQLCTLQVFYWILHHRLMDPVAVNQCMDHYLSGIHA